MDMESQIRRGYVRTDNWRVHAKINVDGKDWHEVEVPDMAAGGLRFVTDMDIPAGSAVWFDLSIDPKIIEIYGEIHIKAKAVVKSDRGLEGGHHSYGVVFSEIASADQIRLDELITLAIHKYKMEGSGEH